MTVLPRVPAEAKSVPALIEVSTAKAEFSKILLSMRIT